MKIRKLEIVGFKSFVDRTVLHFDREVTGIVGPNGCGKSNVVDAIRWAMGEQSAKNLRGKAMEDVIFNGSEARGPHSLAEVSITFENSGDEAPPEYRDYPEITVTRRLDRSGRSDYFINRTPVRLMDVTNLFLGTGVGRRAYSIIEQGRIGYIVSSKPEDRRLLIEEAAGITKFKARKKAAERKMELTRQNLLRVGDIVSEIDKSLASLKRQAQKAERYRAYRTEVRDLELLVASHRWLELTVTARVVGADLVEADAVADGARRGLRWREAELEVERHGVSRLEHDVDVTQQSAYEAENTVRLLEGEIRSRADRVATLREREQADERELDAVRRQRDELRGERDGIASALASLEGIEVDEAEVLARETGLLEERRESAREAEQAAAERRARVGEAATRVARGETVLASFVRRRDEAQRRHEKLGAEREAEGARLAELDQAIDEATARLSTLRSGRVESVTRREEIERELPVLRESIRTVEKALESLRDELSGRRSRLGSLAELQRRLDGVGAGVRALMSQYPLGSDRAARAGVLGLVADRLDCPAGLAPALAAVLGDRLHHVVVRSGDDAAALIEELRRVGKGRATVRPQRVRRTVGDGARASLLASEHVVGRFAELVRASAADGDWVERLLGHVYVVDTLASARALSTLHDGVVFVTRTGEVVGDDGALTGGKGEDAFAHMLEMKREIRELEPVVANLAARHAATADEQKELRRAIAERQAQLDAARNEAHDAELALVRAEQGVKRLVEDKARVEKRLASLAAECDELGAQLALAGDEEAEARAEIDAARRGSEEALAALASVEELHRHRRDAVDAQMARVTELRVRAAEAKQRAESQRGTLERLARTLDDLDRREVRLAAEAQGYAAQQGALGGEMWTLGDELTSASSYAHAARERLGVAKAYYEDAKNALVQTEADIRSVRVRIESLVERLAALTVRERELGMAMSHLLSQIAERHRLDLRTVLGDYHLRDVPDGAVRSRVDELLQVIERMGEINLMAIEEFEAQTKRHEELSRQKVDLEDALAQLDRAIRQMNRESRKLFRDAFIAVNERFKQIFPRMFGGGRAELKLTEADDVLDAGIDIVAQPPGKKLGNLELMSGGEKALTAVSLIFALFQYKPSPFCLLDEVDAPLDEANIGRFASAIRQMTDHSQFIVITHAKRTMEHADVLYGVTMEQPGISKLVAVELTGERAARRQAAVA